MPLSQSVIIQNQMRMQTRHKYNITLILMVCLSLTMAGCSRTESENVTSRGIHADIEVSTGGNGFTDVEAQLTVGSGIGGTLLELSGGDRLLAHANGVTQQMSKDEDLFELKYKTTFNFSDPGTQFRIEFDRSEAVSAPNSVVSLPLAPNITMPIAGETVLNGSHLTVAWEPAFTPDSMRLRFITTCQAISGAQHIREVNRHPRDSGSFRVNTVELVTADPDLLADFTSCVLDITLYRERGGSIDPNYGEGGRIIAIQRRTVIVQLVINPQN